MIQKLNRLGLTLLKKTKGPMKGMTRSVINLADLEWRGFQESENGYVVREWLRPESRGYIDHVFDTACAAEYFEMTGEREA